MTLRKCLPLLLSLIAGSILWAAWPTSPLTFLVFIGFVPLLAITDMVKNRAAYFGLLYLALWIWNTGTTWWVGNTTVPVSGIFANAFNALLMSIPWLGYRIAKERMGKTTGYFALIVYWLTFEYIHQRWELSWPWLTLGNAFAGHPDWVQWYEYTGTLGGSLWILLTNIAVYRLWQQGRVQVKEGWKPLALLAIPFLLSLFAGQRKSVQDPSKGLNIVIVQPNIDPYNEKFTAGSAQVQLQKLLDLSRQKTDSSTDYVIWPETALFTQGAWEHELNQLPEIISIRDFLRQYPRAKIISGATTLRLYKAGESVSPTARQLNDGNAYDAFNAAIRIDTSQGIQIYHKAKLVPGVELTPYVHYFPFMKNLAMDLGGITGSYGLTPGVNLFTSPEKSSNVFSAICYESVFGDFVAQKVKAGANLLAVVTNDGWWGNTEGHRQHLQYARLLAIETRRWVARSANTGISAFIDPYGQVIDPLPYWKEGVIGLHVTSSADLTFYVKYGEYIAKAPVIFCILLLAYTIVLRAIRRQNVENNS